MATGVQLANESWHAEAEMNHANDIKRAFQIRVETR
jgi:hypothetical protein